MKLSDRDIKRLLMGQDLNLTVAWQALPSLKEPPDLVINPLADNAIQPASVDLRLGNECVRFFSRDAPAVDLTKGAPIGLTCKIPFGGEGLIVRPHAFILGSTLEWLELPDYLMGTLTGKSGLGRMGLMIHSTAGHVDPGWKGQLTLEITNQAPYPIILHPGMYIAQISFELLNSPAERPYGSPGLGSHYQGSKTVEAAKL